MLGEAIRPSATFHTGADIYLLFREIYLSSESVSKKSNIKKELDNASYGLLAYSNILGKLFAGEFDEKDLHILAKSKFSVRKLAESLIFSEMEKNEIASDESIKTQVESIIEQAFDEKRTPEQFVREILYCLSMVDSGSVEYNNIQSQLNPDL